jgi:cytochrome c-type biogenesis protein CcmE
MKRRHKRFAIIGGGLVALGIAVALILNAFNKNLVFFFSPTQVVKAEAPLGKTFRLGGLVKDGSVQRQQDGLTVRFVVTDTNESTTVSYKGILPDLFREGQGVVAQGKLGDDGIFYAQEVLAKHDETYMPPEVADALADAKEVSRRTSASLVK